MKPVFMPHLLHDPLNGWFGQCFRACVASIFELPLDDVPHFTNEWAHDEGLTPQEGLEKMLRDWLQPQGYVYMTFRVPAENMETMIVSSRESGMDAHFILGGLSKSGHPHSVVGQYGVVVHDPYPKVDDPDRGVLLPDESFGGYEFGFFVKR